MLQSLILLLIVNALYLVKGYDFSHSFFFGFTFVLLLWSITIDKHAKKIADFCLVGYVILNGEMVLSYINGIINKLCT